MSGKKSVGWASLLLWVILATAFSFATYNFVAMMISSKASNDENLMADGSGTIIPVTRMGGKVNRLSKLNEKFHVAVTATDAAYSQWQCRIIYYWYKRFKDEPGSDTGGFIRVLHSGRSDGLMEVKLAV
ncbi:hypothetical protein Ancab_024614 [Ancistrocladus abbreviatus]